MRVYLIGFVIIGFLVSCVKDKPQEPINNAVAINSDKSVLVINEGNYGWGNASVSLYDPNINAVVADYFKQQNSGLLLGDVCQSITKYNSKYYIVMNNSNKINVVNSSDFSKIASITGFNSPRYLLPITYNKAYVSDLYSNSVQIVDLNTNSISGIIPCMKGTEEMVLIYNKAFIINGNSNYCYVINTSSDVITDSLFIGKEASGIMLDKNAKVWILTKGSASSIQVPKLIKVNPVSLFIEQSLIFNAIDRPWRLCLNKTRDTLYYLNKGVCMFPILNTQLPINPLIAQGSKIYYGLGINPKDYSIYVSDAIDYVQKSKVEVYNTNGSFIKKFNAGIISNGFVFE
jgi:hypothetical protein